MLCELKLNYLSEETSRITNMNDVIEVVKDIYIGEYREVFTVISLDNANFISAITTVSVGGVSSCQVELPNVFKPVLLSNSEKFIIVHNHLGGTLEPSEADLKLTKNIKEAAEILYLTMLDHVIISSKTLEGVSCK